MNLISRLQVGEHCSAGEMHCVSTHWALLPHNNYLSTEEEQWVHVQKTRSSMVITLNYSITWLRTTTKLCWFASALCRLLYWHKLSAKWVQISTNSWAEISGVVVFYIQFLYSSKRYHTQQWKISSSLSLRQGAAPACQTIPSSEPSLPTHGFPFKSMPLHFYNPQPPHFQQ